MKFTFIKQIIALAEQFELDNLQFAYTDDIDGFKSWIADTEMNKRKSESPEQFWQGKEQGRSPESVISTLLVHLNRYAKTYSKSAIVGSDFKTQDEFSYLINLKAFGTMTKTELIKKNIHDKSSGILIINRLINQGWIQQIDSQQDKRSKVLNITEAGKSALENQMDKIRVATKIVSGNLNQSEKMELIRILDKLEKFHQPIFLRNIDSQKLLDAVNEQFFLDKN